MLRKRFSQPPVSAPELIYKQICARFAAPHPSARGAALKAQTRRGAWQHWVYLLPLAGSRNGRGPHRFPPSRSLSRRSRPMPSPSQGYAHRLWVEGKRSGCPAGLRPAPPRTDLGVEGGGEVGGHLGPRRKGPGADLKLFGRLAVWEPPSSRGCPGVLLSSAPDLLSLQGP